MLPSPRTTVRYGFIGCGMMGQEHLRNLALIPGAQVAAVFEPDEGMAGQALALAPGAQRVADVAALLARSDIDALVITSPNHCHAAQLQAVAASRPLPMLCEKPVCTNLADVAALRRLGAASLAPLWVAMEYRYMPPIAALVAAAHQASDTGGSTMLSIREHRYPFLQKVGDWNRFSANTGGTLVEKCCHFFDLMRLLMQADPLRLYASGAMNHNHVDERYGGRQPDILDNAMVVLDFPGQRRALLELCMFADGARYQEEIVVVGPQGKLECKVPGPTRFWPSDSLGDAAGGAVDRQPACTQGAAPDRAAGAGRAAGRRRPQRLDLLPAPQVLRPGARCRRPGGRGDAGRRPEGGADRPGRRAVGPQRAGHRFDGGRLQPVMRRAAPGAAPSTLAKTPDRCT